MGEYTLPQLSYDYDAFKGYISEEVMSLHHTKHHQAYVDKLNSAVEGLDLEPGTSLVDLLRSSADLPHDVRQTIINNGGGHYNHSLFWETLTPKSGGPVGGTEALILNKYGSVQGFIDKFTTEAMGVFGSGWVWMQPDGDIITTHNQDTPFLNGGEEPVFGLDVWEHAYYLDYKNARADYVKAWWSIVNWDFIEDRFKTLNSQ
jgi:Fe-Mn family superoxide dismutase